MATAVNPPGTGTSVAGSGVAWTDPINLTSQDDAYAICALTNGQTSRALLASNFAFDLPDNATISGIKAYVERLASGAGGADASIHLRKTTAGGAISDNRSAGAAWSAVEGIVSFGGTSDLWGLTWSVPEVESAEFGAEIVAAATAGVTLSVDYVEVEITYVVPVPSRGRPMLGVG